MRGAALPGPHRTEPRHSQTKRPRKAILSRTGEKKSTTCFVSGDKRDRIDASRRSFVAKHGFARDGELTSRTATELLVTFVTAQ